MLSNLQLLLYYLSSKSKINYSERIQGKLVAVKRGYQQLKMKVNLKILIEENLIEKNV